MEKTVDTAFVFICCFGFKSHYCPSDLADGLVEDLESREADIRFIESTDKGYIDLPGMCMADRPMEEVVLGEFRLSIPSQDFASMLSRLKAAPLRKFADGSEYFKLHGFHQCLVVSPEQRDELIRIMDEMVADAEKRADEAVVEFGKRMEKVVENRNVCILGDSERKTVVHHDGGEEYPEGVTMGDGSVMKYRPLATIKCMYCGRLATMAKFQDGSVGGIHETPECAEFAAMDVLVFFRENRKKMEQEVDEGKFKPN